MVTNSYVIDVTTQETVILFRGRVLKDDQLIEQYNISAGDTVQVVIRERRVESTVETSISHT